MKESVGGDISFHFWPTRLLGKTGKKAKLKEAD